jgi:hypothetical protein
LSVGIFFIGQIGKMINCFFKHKKQIIRIDVLFSDTHSRISPQSIGMGRALSLCMRRADMRAPENRLDALDASTKFKKNTRQERRGAERQAGKHV